MAYRRDATRPTLTVCYSAESTCVKMRGDGVGIGAVVGECGPRESAYCFTMTDAPQQRVHWRCYESEDDCTRLRKRAMGEQPELHSGECGLTSPARLSQQ